TANHTIAASFALTTHVLMASAGTHGAISPNGAVTVTDSSSQTFTVAPDAGYAVGSVMVDGSSVGAVTSYTFTNAVANHTIQAAFVTQSATALNVRVASSSDDAEESSLGTVTLTSSDLELMQDGTD